MLMLAQEKKAPKKPQGVKQASKDVGASQEQREDLLEDAELPPSTKAMPVYPCLPHQPCSSLSI